jgi:hypothetical protein
MKRLSIGRLLHKVPIKAHWATGSSNGEENPDVNSEEIRE